MTDLTQVEYIDPAENKKTTFWKIVVLSICIVAVVSLLITLVYLITVDKMTPEERLREETEKAKEVKDCKGDENCLSSKIQEDPAFNCTTYIGSKDSCYLQMAKIKGDPNLCTEITDPTIKNECIFYSSPKLEGLESENI